MILHLPIIYFALTGFVRKVRTDVIHPSGSGDVRSLESRNLLPDPDDQVPDSDNQLPSGSVPDLNENIGSLGDEDTNVDSAYIVNGNDADPGEYPWLAVLNYGGGFICGGIIIDETTVLTAAHCIDFDVQQKYGDFEILAGEHKTLVTENVEQLRRVKKVIMHKKYNVKFPRDRDIAVLKLSEPLTWTNRVKKISVASKKQEAKLLKSSRCVAVGVGAINDDRLRPLKVQELSIDIRPRDFCTSITKDVFEKTFTRYMLCSYESYEGPCYGDSGGPVTCMNAEGKHVLTGIVSWGSTACEAGFNVYARVSTLKSWINSNRY